MLDVYRKRVLLEKIAFSMSGYSTGAPMEAPEDTAEGHEELSEPATAMGESVFKFPLDPNVVSKIEAKADESSSPAALAEGRRESILKGVAGAAQPPPVKPVATPPAPQPNVAAQPQPAPQPAVAQATPAPVGGGPTGQPSLRMRT